MLYTSPSSEENAATDVSSPAAPHTAARQGTPSRLEQRHLSIARPNFSYLPITRVCSHMSPPKVRFGSVQSTYSPCLGKQVGRHLVHTALREHDCCRLAATNLRLLTDCVADGRPHSGRHPALRSRTRAGARSRVFRSRRSSDVRRRGGCPGQAP